MPNMVRFVTAAGPAAAAGDAFCGAAEGGSGTAATPSMVRFVTAAGTALRAGAAAGDGAVAVGDGAAATPSMVR